MLIFKKFIKEKKTVRPLNLWGRMGQRQTAVGGPEARNPKEQAGAGLPYSPPGLTAPIPSYRQEKRISQIWSAACLRDSHPIRGRDTRPTLLQ